MEIQGYQAANNKEKMSNFHYFKHQKTELDSLIVIHTILLLVNGNVTLFKETTKGLEPPTYISI